MFYVPDCFYETRFSSSSSLLREFEECAINDLETFHSKIEALCGKSCNILSLSCVLLRESTLYRSVFVHLNVTCILIIDVSRACYFNP